MATFGGYSRAEHTQILRDAWGRARGHASRALRHAFVFVTTYPPLVQGVYYLATGLWCLIAAGSYGQYTGHHADPGLIEVIGVQLLVIGGTLCLAAYRKLWSPEVLLLALGSAVGLLAVDIHLMSIGFAATYFLDSLVQVALIVFWLYGWAQVRQARAKTPPLATPVQTPPPSPHPR